MLRRGITPCILITNTRKNVLMSCPAIMSFCHVTFIFVLSHYISSIVQVQLCGDNAVAKNSVAQLCRDMGFIPVDLGRLSSARDIENAPLRLFPTWTTPVLCALSLFLFFYLFNFLHDVLHPYITSGRNVFYKLPIDTVNVTLPAVAMVMLALVYLPGLLAAFLQLWRGTKYRRFPEWLDRWLQARKQMGLLAFLCAALHAVYSLCLPMRRSARYKMLDAAFRQVRSVLHIVFSY